jgi:hypothetical protein
VYEIEKITDMKEEGDGSGCEFFSLKITEL